MIELVNSLDDEDGTMKSQESLSALEGVLDVNTEDIENLKCNEKIENNTEEEPFCTCKH